MLFVIITALLAGILPVESIPNTDCAEPPTIPYAQIEKTSTTHGSYVTYAFQDPYKLIGFRRAQCLHGEWISMPVCNNGKCEEEPPGIRNGRIAYFDQKHGSKVQYQCDESFVMERESSVFCNVDKWEGDPPLCQKKSEIQCPLLEMNTSRVIFNIHYENNRKVHSVANFACVSRTQKLIGPTSRVCMANGKWSGSYPSCEDITCPRFLTNNSLVVAYTNDNKMNSRATFSCNRNAKLNGENWAVCMPSGQWSNQRPTCEMLEIRCPALNEKGIFSIYYDNDRRIGSNAAFHCIGEGLKLSGCAFRTCQENGEWSGDDPTCVGDNCNVSQQQIRDCSDLLHIGQRRSGVYTISPINGLTENEPIDVYCDMKTDGGGWTVIQRRGEYGNPVDYFYKDWKSYKEGFGDIQKEFWLGNGNIFALTNQGNYSVRFDLVDIRNNTRYAQYNTFRIDDESNKYTLHIADYSGDAGDSMIRSSNNQKFSTKDQDNDTSKKWNCAQDYKGAWWFSYCFNAHLNGENLRGKQTKLGDGKIWTAWKGNAESLAQTEIKIRPKNFRKV